MVHNLLFSSVCGFVGTEGTSVVGHCQIGLDLGFWLYAWGLEFRVASTNVRRHEFSNDGKDLYMLHDP